MKSIFRAGLAAILLVGTFLSLQSCFSDNCSEEITYTAYTPVYEDASVIRGQVGIEGPQAMASTGKIYVRGNFLFISEPNKGIHIYNNSDERNPVNIAFLQIPGNVDLAVKGNILYADSYIDLLVFDISNESNPTFVKRLPAVFPQRTRPGALEADDSKGIVVSHLEEEITEVVDCQTASRIRFENDILASTAGGGGSTEGPSLSGIGGSFARFTISENTLYTVNNTGLQVFNISAAKDPVYTRELSIGMNIETIFPYNKFLFIGSETGMFIYSISNPYNPTYTGQFNHARGCDPVVVDGTRAYVTVRSRSTRCQGALNQLDVVDISTLTSPTLMASYNMFDPHGVGIDGNTLFLCDGSEGLKTFDVQDAYRIDRNLLDREQVDAYDVIPNGGSLIMVGKDGVYQYDYNDPSDLELLSLIRVSP